jgi:hypothetical protein
MVAEYPENRRGEFEKKEVRQTQEFKHALTRKIKGMHKHK